MDSHNKAQATSIDDVESDKSSHPAVATSGGVNLYKDNAIVLIPTPSPDPKGTHALIAVRFVTHPRQIP